MSNPNFVHDLVQMAKAFEELPQVRAELEGISARNSELSETIQRLELRIMDLKTELDKAHDATRKAEVERDHAEQMFLETDDRLNAFQRLLRSFQTDANALVKAAEPTPSEQVSVPQAPTFYPETDHGQPVQNFDAPATPASASGVAEFHGYVGNVDSVSSGPQGQREVGEQIPTAPSADNSGGMAQTVPSASETGSGNIGEGVSVQSDPTPASESSSGNAWPASTPQSDSDNPSVPSPTADAQTSAPQTEAQPMQPDDVGYHNEPRIVNSDWAEWDRWSKRMDAKYGIGRWPERQVAAQ